MKKNGLHINHDGTKYWLKEDKYHRDDGPAIICPDGSNFWYKNDIFHREDGPAVIYPNGTQRWYKYGKRYHPSAHEIMTYKMNEKERSTH